MPDSTIYCPLVCRLPTDPRVPGGCVEGSWELLDLHPYFKFFPKFSPYDYFLDRRSGAAYLMMTTIMSNKRAAKSASVVQPVHASVDRKWHCKMCQYSWNGRKGTLLPKECPQCKSRGWR